MKIKFLSHTISLNTPSYGTLISKLKVSKVKNIDKGDSSNVFNFTMENHLGTHVDCPAHFFINGINVTNYAAETWFFEKPYVIQINTKKNQLIRKEDIGRIPNRCDLLIIKTGFQRYRGSSKYSCANPGLEPEIGGWLRSEHTSLRAIGFDFVSISPYSNRVLGRKIHSAFLDPAYIGFPILIIEDMNLDHDLSNLKNVWVLPLRIEEMDSAPCTVVGVFQ